MNPEFDSSPISAWGYGLASFAYLLFVAYLLRRGYPREGMRSRVFFVAVATSLLWSACGSVWSVPENQGASVLIASADIARYGAWHFFLIALIGASGNRSARWFASIAAVVVVAGLVLQVASLAPGVQARLITTNLVHQLTMVVFGIFLLEQLIRNVDPDSRWNIKPLVLALGSIFLFDLFLFSDALLFTRVDPDIASVRGMVNAAAVPLLSLSVVRGGLRFSKIRLSQQVAIQSTTLLLVGLYLLLMALGGYYVRYWGGEWGRAIQYALFFSALLLLSAVLLSASTRAKIKVLVGKHFFRYRYDYREEWLKFTRILSEQESLEGMGAQVIRGLADMVESPAGTLWLRRPGTEQFCQQARWNMPASTVEEDSEGALCGYLRRTGWVINLEEFRRFASRYQEFEIPEWLSGTPDAWLVVPLLAGNDLVGFVVLARARTEVDVDWEVNDLLKTSGRQAAGFLAQILAAEQLIEARKFEAFNRMSAFVVHDLKNIVTQLALLVRNAERHGDDPEFKRDMLMTVQHSVERMRQLMLQLREGAAPASGQHGVPLDVITKRIGETRSAEGRRIDVTVLEAVRARGHEERIERVIGHAVQNALDATEDRGSVWVTVGREGGRARVTIADTGVGMSPDFVRDRLFKPFQSTKTTGMGIGAYESFQYIRELGGEVRVESAVGEGTSITMLFPLFQSGLHDAERVSNGR